MTLELRHYADAPLELERARVYDQTADHYKPSGFWVSVRGEQDWPTWAREESYRWPEAFAAEYAVTLAPEADVLVLDTLDALKAFDREVGRAKYADMPDYRVIPWRLIAKAYDGIVIAPYQWRARYNINWYGGWDVASGCIWNLAAIARIEPVHELDLAIPPGYDYGEEASA